MTLMNSILYRRTLKSPAAKDSSHVEHTLMLPIEFLLRPSWLLMASKSCSASAQSAPNHLSATSIQGPVHTLDPLLRRGPPGYRRACICKRQYISWTLIGQLTFPMSPSGNSQRTRWGRRWREIRLWAIKLMKEGKDRNGRAEGKQD